MEHHPLLHRAGRAVSHAPPGQEGARHQPGQVDRHRRQVRGEGEPRGVPPPGGAGGDRPHPDPVRLPGSGHLRLRPVGHGVYAPVHRRRLHRRPHRLRRGDPGVGAPGAGPRPAHLGGGPDLSGPARPGRPLLLPEAGI